MGKTIRISDEDYEKATGILNKTKETMAELFSRCPQMPGDEDGSGDLSHREECQQHEEIRKNRRLLYRLIRTVCPLTEDDVNDPEFGIGLVDIYEDKNKHPEKYR